MHETKRGLFTESATERARMPVRCVRVPTPECASVSWRLEVVGQRDPGAGESKARIPCLWNRKTLSRCDGCCVWMQGDLGWARHGWHASAGSGGGHKGRRPTQSLAGLDKRVHKKKETRLIVAENRSNAFCFLPTTTLPASTACCTIHHGRRVGLAARSPTLAFTNSGRRTMAVARH